MPVEDEIGEATTLVDDAYAFLMMGTGYNNGDWGLPQDLKKALELYIKAYVGSASAHNKMVLLYHHGEHVPRDEKKAMAHCQKHAMTGDELSRHTIGKYEARLGKTDRSIRHYYCYRVWRQNLSG